MTPAIETVESLDEYRARFLCAKAGMNADRHWRQYLDYAVELRQADERAGLVTVPREPTAAMHEAVDFVYGDWDDHGDVYRGMLAASPFSSAAQGEGGE